jgi:hypothetical protein
MSGGLATSRRGSSRIAPKQRTASNTASAVTVLAPRRS